jgi:hypothetical protein
MDAPQRGALMFVRFVAACLMGMSVVELALDWAEFKYRQVPMNIWIAALWGIVFVAGVAVLFMAKSIANWLSDKLE